VALIFNSLVEISSYPLEFFVSKVLIIDVLSLVEKVLKTKDEEG
jgi:hypothetical protein